VDLSRRSFVSWVAGVVAGSTLAKSGTAIERITTVPAKPAQFQRFSQIMEMSFAFDGSCSSNHAALVRVYKFRPGFGYSDLMNFHVHPCGMLRWIANPGEELIVSHGCRLGSLISTMETMDAFGTVIFRDEFGDLFMRSWKETIVHEDRIGSLGFYSGPHKQVLDFSNGLKALPMSIKA
jgi:hypothetical protein